MSQNIRLFGVRGDIIGYTYRFTLPERGTDGVRASVCDLQPLVGFHNIHSCIDSAGRLGVP